MKKLFIFSLLLVNLVSPNLSSIAQVLPNGTELEVMLLETVRSATASVGQKIKAVTAQEVRSQNGALIIAEGAPVLVEVSQVNSARRAGKGGSLTLEFLEVKAQNNQSIPLETTIRRSGPNTKAATAGLAVLLGPPGLLLKGNEASIGKGSIITVTTSSSALEVQED